DHEIGRNTLPVMGACDVLIPPDNPDLSSPDLLACGQSMATGIRLSSDTLTLRGTTVSRDYHPSHRLRQYRAGDGPFSPASHRLRARATQWPLPYDSRIHEVHPHYEEAWPGRFRDPTSRGWRRRVLGKGTPPGASYARPRSTIALGIERVAADYVRWTRWPMVPTRRQEAPDRWRVARQRSTGDLQSTPTELGAARRRGRDY